MPATAGSFQQLPQRGCGVPLPLLPPVCRRPSPSCAGGSSFTSRARPRRFPPLTLLLLCAPTAELLLLSRASSSPPLLSLPLATHHTIGPDTKRKRECLSFHPRGNRPDRCASACRCSSRHYSAPASPTLPVRYMIRRPLQIVLPLRSPVFSCSEPPLLHNPREIPEDLRISQPPCPLVPSRRDPIDPRHRQRARTLNPARIWGLLSALPLMVPGGAAEMRRDAPPPTAPSASLSSSSPLFGSEQLFESGPSPLVFLPLLLIQGGGMDLSRVGEKLLSSVRSARSLGLLPPTPSVPPPRPEVPCALFAPVVTQLSQSVDHSGISLLTFALHLF
jgi:hypothetical protein